MSGTAKTVLIVGGVAVGVVVLMKALAPSPAKAATKPSGLVQLSGLISPAISAISGLFGSGAGSGPDSADAYTRSVYGTDAAQAALRDLQSSPTVSVTDNFMYTAPDDGFIAG